jgi:hypothetical protein
MRYTNDKFLADMYACLKLDPEYTDEVNQGYEEFDRQDPLHMVSVDTRVVDLGLALDEAIKPFDKLLGIPLTASETLELAKHLAALQSLRGKYQHLMADLMTYKARVTL